MDKDNNLFLNKENKTDVIELEESDNENYEQIILDDEDDEDGENSSSLSSNNFNTIIKKDKIINNGNSYEHKGQINQQQKKILSFEESIDNLKDNFKKSQLVDDYDKVKNEILKKINGNNDYC